MTDKTPPSPDLFEKDKPGAMARSAAENATERLRQGGGAFVEAVAATRMPMAITDAGLPDNPIVYANPAFLELSGYPLDEVLGQQPDFMDGPETDPADARRFRAALEEDRDETVEAVQYRRDGSRFVAAVFLNKLKDEEGRTRHHFLSYMDITRRVEAEAALRRRSAEVEQRAQEALRDLMHRNGEILENISDAFYAVDRDWRFTYVNRKAEQWWGRHRAELLGTVLWEQFPQAVGSEPYEGHLRAAAAREVVRLEAVSPILGGWVDITIYPAADGGLSVYFRDISEKKKAEVALRESEERHRLIVENARDYAIIVTDPRNVIMEWSPGAEAVYGWAREEAVGQLAAMTFTPGDRAARVPEWEIETAAREGSAPDVRWHQRKDGSEVFIEGMNTPLRSEDGSIRGYLKIGQDVSARRSAQEALEASERRMRTLVHGIPQMVFRSLSGGERIWGSPQWIEYTGLSLEESLGLGWLDAIHPDDRPASIDAWETAEERREYYVEHRIRLRSSDEYRWHQTRALPSTEEGGRIDEWLGTSTDVEELRRLQRHQQTLLAELQHRVRNTLGVIRSIARRTAATSDNVEDMAMHLEGRIGAFSRVQAVVTRTPEAGVDLAAMVEDELLAHAAREGEMLKIDGPEIYLKPRPAETMSLAVHELATNAVKYGALGVDGGRVAVTWERKPQDGRELLEFVWEENGVPAPPREPQRLGFGFELLQRTLPYELGGETKVEFRPEGLRFTMIMPLGPAMLAE